MNIDQTICEEITSLHKQMLHPKRLYIGYKDYEALQHHIYSTITHRIYQNDDGEETYRGLDLIRVNLKNYIKVEGDLN